MAIPLADLGTIKEENEQDGSASGQIRKPSTESFVNSAESKPMSPPKPKTRSNSPSFKNDPSRSRTNSLKGLITKIPSFRKNSYSEHYAELKDEKSPVATDQGFNFPEVSPSEVLEEDEKEGKEEEKETTAVEKKEVKEEKVEEEKQIVPEPLHVDVPPDSPTAGNQKSTPGKQHKPRLAHKTPPKVLPKTPARVRPPPSPKLPKIPPSPVLGTREGGEYKSDRPKPRSRAASVIQRAVKHHIQKRNRAFTNATVETKEALRISRTFQTIYDLRSHAVKWSDLKDMRQLSAGMFGEVHIAKHKGHLVVVKTLKQIRVKPDSSERRHKKAAEEQQLAIEDFKKEMSLLTKLWHRNIVHLIGVGVNPQLFMVMEYMSGGSLKDILADCRQRKEVLSRKVVYEYGMDCAQGMKYLHEAFPRILHRDLKPANLLISKLPEKNKKAPRPELKIADFGLSRVLGPTKTSSTERYRLTGGTGSLRYMAPEVAANQPYNEKADVYGFGIILWEMLANDLPYKKLHTHNFYKEVVKKKVRPPMDLTWPDEVIQLISECWDDNPDKRPTFRKIIERLRLIKQKTNFFDDPVEDAQVTACGACLIA